MKTPDFPKIFIDTEESNDNEYCNFDIVDYLF